MLTITATDLPRFMQCNGFRLVEGFVPLISDDTVRNEGNAAHWLAQQVHGGKAIDELTDRKAFNGVYVTPEMVDNITAYLEGIGRGGRIEYETTFRDPYARWEVRSRADHVNVIGTTLRIDDLKYGWGIVEPEKHWTLIAHALGFIINNPNIPITEIIFTIYQPRPHHNKGKVRSWKIGIVELQGLYGEMDLKLSNPDNNLVTGAQCKDCPALVNCPSHRKAQMNALDVVEMAYTDKLENKDLAWFLDTVERAAKILDGAQKAYEELAKHRLREGQIIPNYVLENELTNRTWKEGITPEAVLAITGKDLTKKQLITPKQAETAGVSEAVVASLCERRNKGAKLVRKDVNARANELFGKKEG